MNLTNRLITTALLATLTTNANCAFNGLSHHSRANCAGFNETVTWWYNHPIVSRVESKHYPLGIFGKTTNMHEIILPKTNEFRHAAYHIGEISGTYTVTGYHFMYVKNREILVQTENVIDCSIYDGWWNI